MDALYNFFEKKFKLNRITTLNLIFGFMLAITPLKYISLSAEITSSPNSLGYKISNPIPFMILGMALLLIWIFDFWAAKYRVNVIHYTRQSQNKKGVSMIGVLGYLHLFPSLALAGTIGTLLGFTFNAIAIFTPILVIIALAKEFYLTVALRKRIKSPTDYQTKQKDVLSDAVMLLYAYFIFILTWVSFVNSGHFQIDFSKSGVVFTIFFAAIIYLLFYIGACWVWFEEILVGLQTKQQKLRFLAVFGFELIVVILKLVKW